MSEAAKHCIRFPLDPTNSTIQLSACSVELTPQELGATIDGYLTAVAIYTDGQGKVLTKNRAVRIWLDVYHGNLLRKVENQMKLAVASRNYCSLAYSALACFRMGMPGRRRFQRARKSL